MAKRGLWTLALLLLSAGFWAGCDTPPQPRKNLFVKIDTVTVSHSNTDELQLVQRLEQARARYESSLRRLHAFYIGAGNLDKKRWAYREHENLRQAQAFRWVGVDQGPAADSAPPDTANENALVEAVAAARRQYLETVTETRDYYRRRGPTASATAVNNILQRFDLIRTYLYLDAAEYPPLDRRPADRIPEADRLFQQAHGLFRRGKGFMGTFVTTNYAKQRRALALFKDLTQRYPNSDKAPPAAFFVGEIYKEYFNEDVRAVHWYERAWTWDPAITEPARFQAASVYDFRLQDKVRAIELYEAAIRHEQFNPDNMRYAAQRIPEIRPEAVQQQARLRQAGQRPQPIAPGAIPPPDDEP
ncbi:MAG: tetratricopeptide repeat protein [Planctomycetota bacterium]|jgi:TolA-binding protein